jgi:hypothetical protein
MFIIGWVLWFAINKHPVSLGVVVPAESGNMLHNFQLAFDMFKGGYLKASFVFLWKAHFIVLSLIVGLLSSIVFQSVSDRLRRRRLHEVMRPEIPGSDKTSADE